MTDTNIPLTKISILFPGQGSQSVGMGKVWKDTKSWEITKVAGEILSLDFEELLIEENDLLQKTEYAQLAILVTSLMAWEEFKKSPLIDQFNVEYFAGHSLGQITALVAAGVFNFEDGILFAQKRAQVTQQCAKEHDGVMAAFIGGTLDDAKNICNTIENIWIANDNCLGQIVLGGDRSAIQKALEISKENNFKIAKEIPVDGAFHTPHMQKAEIELEKYLIEINLNDSLIPIISNDDAIEYTQSSIWKEKLPKHVTNTVNWSQTMNFLSNRTNLNLEVGCGNILTGLAKRHQPKCSIINISKPLDIETFEIKE